MRPTFGLMLQTSPGHIVVVDQKHSPDQGNKGKDHPESYLHRLFAADNLPNVLLFFAGLGGIAVGLGTLKVIRQQTELLGEYVRATKDGVIATRNSVQATIDAERAWVVPELRPHAYQGKDGTWFQQNNSRLPMAEVVAGKHLQYSLKLTNMGRTPAQILGFEILYTCLPEGIRDLPENARGDHAEFHEFHHLLGGDGTSIEINEPVIDVGQHMVESWDSIRKFKNTAVVHGYVRYRHMFSTDKDSYADFCYVYAVNLNRLSSVGRNTKQR